MKKYRLLNNCIGWAVFLIASIVYLMTAESTASWWDCGEYIATTFKLQVGHPPGAPTFQLIGRLFALLAGGDTAKVALMINSMSALCSGFTILFLFWSITLLAKKLVKDPQNMTTAQMIAVFGSGIVGALAYTFSDTFWYSAVEGEVYAMSSCFTAIVFWAILKWDEQADKAFSLRWLILIAFLIGVAIGVHLLNILTVPAIVYIIYFKKYPKTTTKGLLLAGVVSVLTVALIMYFIIPEIVSLASHFEVFFVNSIGLPFNTGTIIYFLLLFGLIVFFLRWSRKRSKYILNTALLSILFIILGYSTFLTLIIRANANTPINEHATKDAVSLLTYLNREQYGYTPLIYGPYYTASVARDESGAPLYKKSTKYVKDKQQKKYIPIKRTSNPKWDSKDCTLFPRMYSTDDSRRHVIYYKMWSGKSAESYTKPTFAQNLKYFFRYQVHHMYWRYFMWNFVGRQNDIQSYGLQYESSPADASNGTKDLIHGNWISGIGFLDAARLGPQSNLPDELQNNAGRNKLYFLPLLLGIAGLVYHIKKNGKDAFVVFLLFFMTGLAIVLYLNQPPNQPRERDYAYAGSFYAFAIWIGLGVFALCDWLKKIKLPENIRNIAITAICFLAVPILMASQEWDDHDRHNRYMARDFASNYLNSCKKNAILITFGDNDTFPLWYDQEVEGMRTDVRILNYTLSGMHWYVHELYNKLYESDAIKFTLDSSYYAIGQDVNFARYSTDTMELERALKKIERRSPEEIPFSYMPVFKDYQAVTVLPTTNFKISFDKAKAAEQGIYPKELVDGQKGEFVFSLQTQNMDQEGRMKYAQLYRQELMLLDILGSNHFERPIYVVNPYLLRDVIPNIMDYCVQEGMVYRIVPYKVSGNTITDNSYDLFVNKFVWGNVKQPGVYVENAVTYANSKSARQNYARLAQILTDKGQKDKAIKVLDKAVEEFPNNKVAFDKSDVIFAQAYCRAGDLQKGHDIYKQIINYYRQYINYYNQFSGKKARNVEGDKNLSIIVLAQVHSDLQRYKMTDLCEQIEAIPTVKMVLSSFEFQNQFGQIISSVNSATAQLANENTRQEAITTLLDVLTQLEQASPTIQDGEMLDKLKEVVQFVYANAMRNSAKEITDKIQNSQELSSCLQQSAAQPNLSLTN